MIDIALNDAYIHAETPEEEQEVGILLNGALSGKTTCANGCIYPDQDGSTVGKGFILTLNENIGLRVSPVLDVDGTPGLELYCAAGATQTVPDKAPYEMELGIEPVQDHYTLKDYIIVILAI